MTKHMNGFPRKKAIQRSLVSLFAGGGGLHLGFRDAGFSTQLASDSWKPAADTFAFNFPDVPFHLGDIRHLTPAKVRELIAPNEIDIVVGGPPCQGFSTLGDQIQGDPRNSLFEAFARLVSWVQPKAVLIENTSYLRSQYAGVYESEIRSVLERLGYSVYVETLNAADYGAPQVRRRVFFFATRIEAQFQWPVPTHAPVAGIGVTPYRTVGDAIMDLADLRASSLVRNHEALRHSARVIARYRLIPEGGRLPPPQELPADIRRRNFGNTYKRLHRNRPSLTLVPGNNAFPVHPTEDRSLTPREGARLQGFPDAYVFSGSRAEQCKLVGNAVPVQLARALAEAIQAHFARAAVQRTKQLSFKSTLTRSLPKTKSRKPSRHSAVSFFTGAGGLLLGFERSGFNVLASYDRKRIVATNLQNNFPALRHYHRDLEEMTASEVLQDCGQKADVVFGGSPCQGFSIFGKRRFVYTRDHEPSADPRNELTLRFVDLAVKLDPRIVVLENVKGLTNTPRNRTSYLSEIERRFKKAGFTVEARVLNCADFGVPQARERLIVIASKPGVDFQWPQPKYFAHPKSWQKPYVTVGDVISDLMDPDTHSADFSHVPMSHKPLLVARYKLIPEGGRLPEDKLPAKLRKGYRSDNIKNYSHVYRRMSRFSPATTLVPGHNAFPIHPVLPRALTVREAARIQTFPDAVQFTGTRQQQCMLVGNAVPPVLAAVIAQAVAKAIDGNAARPDYKADHYELKARA